jgi:predicted site-specific integrase-resolvase
MNQIKQLLTQKDVAMRLKITAPTLRRWQQKGEIGPTAQIGKILVYDETEVEALAARIQPFLPFQSRLADSK